MIKKPTYQELEKRIKELEQAETEPDWLEEELRKNEEKLQLLFDNSPIGIGTVDMSGNFVSTNSAYERMLGYTKEELRELSLFDVTHPDYRPKNRELFQNMFALNADGFNIEKVCIRKDGKPVYVNIHASAVKDDEGNTRFGTAFVEDITERKQTEMELIRSKQLIDSVLNGIADPVFVKDDNHRWVILNDAFCTMVGKRREELLGTTVFDLYPESQAGILWEHDHLILDSNKSDIIEGKFSIGKRKRYLSTSKSSFDNPVTGGKNIVGTIRDITDEKRIEKQFQQAQKMESVGRLAGGVAHDYNNISTIIIGYAELALEEIEPTNPLYDDLIEILTAAKRSADITRQLLAFARRQPIAPKVLDINNIVEGMLKMLQRLIGEDIDLSWLPSEAPLLIKMDPSQIDQILANLSVNARDAISGVGKLTVEIGKTSFDEDYCSIHPGFVIGDFARLTVSDNGCGMDQETLKKIFEPFYTTKDKDKGTGLGLATVYGIVKQNDGFINVYSEPDEGTSFKIYFPLYESTEGQDHIKTQVESVPMGNKTILLVEDDSTILKMTTKMLKLLGHTVLTAVTPEKAISLAREYDGNINLLLTDVIMPGMNGRELAEKLLSIYPSIRCLFMSGYTANVIAHHGVLDEGINFIQKPFSKQDLSAKLHEVLDDVKN